MFPFVSNNHQRDFTSHRCTITHPEIPQRSLKIGRSPPGCGKPETCSASSCSTISFSVRIVSIVLQIRAGRCEVTATVLSQHPSLILPSSWRMSKHSKDSRTLLFVVVCHGGCGRLRNRQHAEGAMRRGDACASPDLLTRLSPEDVDEGRAVASRCSRRGAGRLHRRISMASFYRCLR